MSTPLISFKICKAKMAEIVAEINRSTITEGNFATSFLMQDKNNREEISRDM
jgi:hypothetical protein